MSRYSVKMMTGSRIRRSRRCSAATLLSADAAAAASAAIRRSHSHSLPTSARPGVAKPASEATSLDASIDGLLSGDFSLATIIGLGCAREQLSQVATIVDGETTALQAAVSRANVVTAALGGGT